MIKDRVLALLWENTDRALSGAELARQLSVSRTAVWKAVEQLRGEGYPIQSAPRRGYRLSPDSDVLSEAGIRRYLRHQELAVRIFPVLSSTNTVLKDLAAQGAPEGTVLVAGEQTAGRGRLGRSFYSPAGTGLYMSLLLRPALSAPEAAGMTACAAVAVAGAIEELAGVPAGIKWVNDVLVAGIGINTRLPAADFPEPLRDIAGAVFEGKDLPELRCRLAAAVLDRFLDDYRQLGEKPFYEDYRRRSLVLGREILLLSPGRDPVPAKALDIDRDFALLAELEDGSLRRVNAGEVSIRAAK